MSQGPFLVVCSAGRPAFASALDEAQMFPVIEVSFADAAKAVAQVQPSAVLADMAGADPVCLAGEVKALYAGSRRSLLHCKYFSLQCQVHRCDLPAAGLTNH